MTDSTTQAIEMGLHPVADVAKATVTHADGDADPGSMVARPRSRPQRRRDTEHRLTHDIDIWVASASVDGAPYLVPLSFDWDGEALLVATPADSPTGRNLATTRVARMALGHTRDVSIIETSCPTAS